MIFQLSLYFLRSGFPSVLRPSECVRYSLWKLYKAMYIVDPSSSLDLDLDFSFLFPP